MYPGTRATAGGVTFASPYTTQSINSRRKADASRHGPPSKPFPIQLHSSSSSTSTTNSSSSSSSSNNERRSSVHHQPFPSLPPKSYLLPNQGTKNIMVAAPIHPHGGRHYHQTHHQSTTSASASTT